MPRCRRRSDRIPLGRANVDVRGEDPGGPERHGDDEPTGIGDGAEVPLAILARCLRQHDLDLDSIDVISHGARCHGDGRIAEIYDDVLGPLPAAARRKV